jgi:ornithine cyclodeaminase/alanine dehydrogenase
MDGGYLTAMRTGAASGVATKYLAREDTPQTVGIFGAGVQARAQLWAVTVARDISEAYVYDPVDSVADDFVSNMSHKLGLEVTKVASPEAVLEADIICTATSSADPIFDGHAVRAGTHINAIGSHTPNARELDTEIIKRSKVVGDSRTACFSEAGDIMIPLSEGAIQDSHFYAELGEVITGSKDGRTGDDEITLFKSNGLAIQDAAAAKIVYGKATKEGIGVKARI